jgi:hypothetical protein
MKGNIRRAMREDFDRSFELVDFDSNARVDCDCAGKIDTRWKVSRTSSTSSIAHYDLARQPTITRLDSTNNTVEKQVGGLHRMME